MTDVPAAIIGKEAEAYLERRLAFPLPTLLRFPKYLLIETINACNARCVMCGIDFDARPKRIMDTALFDRIADEIGLFRDHVEKVMLYLDGEPLLDKKLSERVRRMKAVGVRKVNIATNASLLDESRAISLIKAGLDEIYITLDSLRPEVYEAIRRRLRFAEVLENILGFIALRDRRNPDLAIRLQMIQQEANRDEGSAFEAYWKERLGPRDQIVVQRAHNWAGAAPAMAFGDEASVNDVPCIALWGTMAIHVDGTVPLCCMDTGTRHPLGDLRHQGIEEVWRGEALARLRAPHLAGKRAGMDMCDGCTLWREAKHASDGSGMAKEDGAG